MKKYIYLIFSLFIFIPFVANAETLTYNVCKSGCEYNSIDDVLNELEALTNNDELANDDVIINFTKEETYTNANRDKEYVIGYKNNSSNVNSITINGNNSNLEYYKIIVGAKRVEIHNLNLTPFYNTKEEYEKDNNLFSFEQRLVQNGSRMEVETESGEIDNVTSTEILIGGTSETNEIVINDSKFNIISSQTNKKISINNTDLGAFVTMKGTYDIDNSVVFLTLVLFGESDTIINISNSKIQYGSSIVNYSTNVKCEINMYNPIFDKKFVYVKAKQDGNQIDIDYDSTIPIGDGYYYDDAKDLTNTMIYFDKDAKLKPDEIISLTDLLSYYTEDKEIEYTIEDESIAKIENKELIGLKEGSTKVTVTTDDGHVVYNINLVVEKETIPEKIDKMTIKVPITGSKIKIWIVVVSVLLLAVIGSCIYMLIKNKKVTK